MKAFYNDQRIKDKYLNRVRAHALADEIVKRAIDAGIITANKQGMVLSSRRPKKPLGCRNTKGYTVFTLHFKGTKKQIKAHRAVWIYFNGIPKHKTILDHINGIKHDNRIENLRLVSEKENAANRRSYSGSQNPSAKITHKIAKQIRKEHSTGWSYQALATHFKISKTLVATIIRRQSWV